MKLFHKILYEERKEKLSHLSFKLIEFVSFKLECRGGKLNFNTPLFSFLFIFFCGAQPKQRKVTSNTGGYILNGS
jgi:hypothetical protein